MNTTFFDTEYLISNLYGLPTNIPGFDTLFGEGGLILPELVKQGKNENDSLGLFTNILPSRTIAISGESGSGKTTLGLQLAGEVAQKGGLSWYMPLEQTINECLYTLKSFQSYNSFNYYIGTDVYETKKILEIINNKYGALIILYPKKDTLEKLLSTIKANAMSFNEEKLNLFVIDSINSVRCNEDSNARATMVDFINKFESLNKNLLIIAEKINNKDRKIENNLYDFFR